MRNSIDGRITTFLESILLLKEEEGVIAATPFAIMTPPFYYYYATPIGPSSRGIRRDGQETMIAVHAICT